MEGLAARKQTRIESIPEEKAAAKKVKPEVKAKEKKTEVVSEAKAEVTLAKIKEEKTEAAPEAKPCKVVKAKPLKQSS